jgi:hypothetical protein
MCNLFYAYYSFFNFMTSLLRVDWKRYEVHLLSDRLGCLSYVKPGVLNAFSTFDVPVYCGVHMWVCVGVPAAITSRFNDVFGEERLWKAPCLRGRFVHAWGVEGCGVTRNETGEVGVKSSPKPCVRTSSRSALLQGTTFLHNMERGLVLLSSG